MNWLPVQTTVAPTEEPLALADALVHCRVESGEDDAAVTAFSKAARAYVEAYTGTRLITQTVKLRVDGFADEMRLPIAPIQSATVEYIDAAGATTTLSTDVYDVLPYGLAPKIVLAYGQSWPAIQANAAAVTITAVAGYGAAEAVPDDILLAMKLLVADWYDNRADISSQSMTAVPNGVTALLANYRMFSFG